MPHLHIQYCVNCSPVCTLGNIASLDFLHSALNFCKWWNRPKRCPICIASVIKKLYGSYKWSFIRLWNLEILLCSGGKGAISPHCNNRWVLQMMFHQTLKPGNIIISGGKGAMSPHCNRWVLQMIFHHTLKPRKIVILCRGGRGLCPLTGTSCNSMLFNIFFSSGINLILVL